VAPLAFSSLALPLAAFAAFGVIAAVRPAWRTARMDPAVALREE
jgi:ABC-type antimicrobial peptide transport system permease subunit